MFLGSSVWLHQKLADLYDRLAIFLGTVKFESDWETLYAFTCCLHGCRYQLLMGALTLLRGHRTDCATYVRKTIEFATFATVMIRNQPASRDKPTCEKCGYSLLSEKNKVKDNATSRSMSSIWLSANNNKNAFQRYKSNFEIMTALRNTQETFPTMYRKYEELSKQVHPTFLAVAGHTKMVEEEDGLRHLFEYFESRGENKLHMIAFMLLWSIEIHFEIIRGLANELQAVSKFDIEKWNQDLEQFQSIMTIEKEHWRPILDPNGKYAAKPPGGSNTQE